jgi:hypothetical protein
MENSYLSSVLAGNASSHILLIFLLYKPQGKKLDRRLRGRYKWDDSIKTDQREIRCDDMGWVYLAQVRDH